MSIKIKNTTVINDNRGLENITNLKTINGESILGTGNVVVQSASSPATPRNWLEPAAAIVVNPNLTLAGLSGLTLSGGQEGIRVLVTSPNCAGIYISRVGAWETSVEMSGSLTFWFLNASIIANDGMGFSSWACTSTFDELTAGTLKFSQIEGALSNSVIGSSTFSTDITVNGHTIGKGSGIVDQYTFHEWNANSLAIGLNALWANETGQYNIAIGQEAMKYNVSGQGNLAIGNNSMFRSNGNYNIAIGTNSLASCDSSAENNIVINSEGSVFDITSESNRVVMGNTAVTNAYIQVAWTVVSDARDKTNFAAIPHGLEFVKQLKPTAYQFRESRESEATNGGVRYGFKAQDIAAIEPEGVIVDTTNPEKFYYNESNLVPVLVKSIQELLARIEVLEKKVQ